MDSLQKSAWRTVAVAVLLARTVTAEPAQAEFQVEAYHASDLAQRYLTYRVVPPDSVDRQVLHDALQQAAPALADAGFVPVPAGATPDLEITLEFEVVERTEPRSRYTRRFRPVTHHVHTVDVIVSDGEGNQSIEQQRVMVPVDNGYRAVSSRGAVDTFFEKRFVMAAREVISETDGTRPPRELWRVIVTNKDAQDDIATYARIMVGVAIDFIGRNGEGRANVVVPGRRFASAAD